MLTPAIIWDRTSRILHWLIATSVVLNLFFLDGGDRWHRYIGYFAFGCLSCRFIWGFYGGLHSRFRNFPMSRSKVLEFIGSEMRMNSLAYIGHNPLASWVYVSIWCSILFLTISGWLLKTDAMFGEEWLEVLHKSIAVGLEIFIVGHFLGIIKDSLAFRRKTWLAMIRGHR